MGFQKRWDVVALRQTIGSMMSEIRSPYNDGWTSAACKYDLYLLKCFIEDHYDDLPKFSEEVEWEKQRLVDKLRESD